MTEVGAVIAAVLLIAIAAFQVALAAGAPWGGMAWGGVCEGRLPVAMRIGSAGAVGLLILAAFIVLALAGVISWSPIPAGALRPVTWGIAGFMALNTLGNVASKSSAERLVFGPATALLVVLCVIVAVNGDGPG